ncbi:hypothetical protein [Nonomuraea glycinis]|uniref:hypothetical protein n=1 Tax=Nonomuraea glycinis TaxID=2047744 RepID=UPI002E1109C8|nr:hypothetical protein OHA68_34745 [Nonomuraea glycinis]
MVNPVPVVPAPPVLPVPRLVPARVSTPAEVQTGSHDEPRQGWQHLGGTRLPRDRLLPSSRQASRHANHRRD